MSGKTGSGMSYTGTQFSSRSGTFHTFKGKSKSGMSRTGGRSRTGSRSGRSGTRMSRSGMSSGMTRSGMSGTRSYAPASRSAMSRSGMSRSGMSRSGYSKSGGSRSMYGGEDVIYEEDESSCISPCCIFFWLITMIAAVLLTALICMEYMPKEEDVVKSDDPKATKICDEINDYTIKIKEIKIKITDIKIKIDEAKIKLKKRKDAAEAAGKKTTTKIVKVPYKASWFESTVLPFVVGGIGLVGGWTLMGYFNNQECTNTCEATLSQTGSKQWAKSTCDLLNNNATVKANFAKGGHHLEAQGGQARLIEAGINHTTTREIVVGAEGVDLGQQWVLKGTEPGAVQGALSTVAGWTTGWIPGL